MSSSRKPLFWPSESPGQGCLWIPKLLQQQLHAVPRLFCSSYEQYSILKWQYTCGYFRMTFEVLVGSCLPNDVKLVFKRKLCGILFFCIVLNANIPQRYPYLLSCVETGCVSEFCADFRRHHPRCASVRSPHMTGEWVYGGSSWHHAGSEWHSSAGESGIRKHIKVKCILVQRKQKLHPIINACWTTQFTLFREICVIIFCTATKAWLKIMSSMNGSEDMLWEFNIKS